MVNLLNYREDCHTTWNANVDEALWHCMVPAYGIWQYVQQIIENAHQDGHNEISIMLHTEIQGNQVSIFFRK